MGRWHFHCAFRQPDSAGDARTGSPTFSKEASLLATTVVATSKVSVTSLAYRQVTEWVRLACVAAFHSSTLPEVLKSTKIDVHLAKMMDSYAPLTAAYLSKWRHWIRFASACKAKPYKPSIALLLDFLATHSKSQLRTATTWIRSLQFISWKAHLDALRLSLHSKLVSAYGRSGSIIKQRDSARCHLVLSFFLSAALDTSLSAQQRIIVGSFLLCIFASLRFSDALWCPPGRLSGECLLGVCMKTKTTRVRCRLEPLLAVSSIAGPKGGRMHGCILFRLPCKPRPCCILTLRQIFFWPGWVLMLLSLYSLHPCRGRRALCCYASSFPFAVFLLARG